MNPARHSRNQKRLTTDYADEHGFFLILRGSCKPPWLTHSCGSPGTRHRTGRQVHPQPRMKKSRVRFLAILFCFAGLCSGTLWTGCSPGTVNDWADPASGTQAERRRAFVAEQEETGVSEIDAKREWDRQQMIEDTRGERRGFFMTADELLNVE